jgi:transcriptional regulator with XRE-family HTH domain
MEQRTPNIGPRIRAIREQRKLSLRALAEQCNLSINAISLIERGENSPTVSSLHALATALKVKITEFFEDSHQEASVVVVRHNHRLSTKGNGYFMESLGLGLLNQQIEPFFVIADAPEPGGDTHEMVMHPGQEFVYCLEGEIHYHICKQTYCLEPGDSLLFDATQPHRFHSGKDSPSKMLLIFQSVDGSHLARQRHLEPINGEHNVAEEE